MSINVYYLDDEETLCEIFSEMLGSSEVKVTTFVQASDAIECCKNNPPDLFFIDYRLPGTTGDLVAFEIAERIPKVLVTGDLSFDSSYKFQNVISKPCDFEKVKKLIETYL